MGPVIGINHQTVSPKAAVFGSARCMEIPCTKNLLSYTQMPKVSVIRLEIAFFGRVGDRSDTDATVPLARKAIAEFQLKVRNVFIACIVQVSTYFTTGTRDDAV